MTLKIHVSDVQIVIAAILFNHVVENEWGRINYSETV